MDQVLALRPFVPAKSRETSRNFYNALGFVTTLEDDDVTMLKLGAFSFILTKFYTKEAAENCMLQLMVRDVESWWRDADPAAVAAKFEAKPPRPPAMQPWGMKVGFIFDPSGVLWHIAEARF
jgi:uncharacterized glyoxalase superfamily protein PhnB